MNTPFAELAMQIASHFSALIPLELDLLDLAGNRHVLYIRPMSLAMEQKLGIQDVRREVFPDIAIEVCCDVQGVRLFSLHDRPMIETGWPSMLLTRIVNTTYSLPDMKEQEKN